MPGLARVLPYVAVLAVCFALGQSAGWTSLARRVDNQAYDFFVTPPAASAPSAVVVAVDEATLREGGEMQNIRPILAQTLRAIQPAQPAAVVLDVTLGGASRDPHDDAQLAAALEATPNLVLNCVIDRDGHWEDPYEPFARHAAAVGHAILETDGSDGVMRVLPLDRMNEGQPRWALALEAYRVAHGLDILASTADRDLDVGPVHIPAQPTGARLLYVRFGALPMIAARAVARHPERLRGKTVFVGVTALSAAKDRLKIPSGEIISGVEAHAHAYETLRRGAFFTEARNSTVVGVSLALAVLVGAAFWFLPGWLPYLLVLPLLAASVFLPRLFLAYGIVFPLVAPVSVAWLTAAGAATFQYLATRRALRRTQSEKARYQQAIHWAAHEMRTPLTAIQGSSELMSRYALPEAKREQLSAMIHSESKRLARIIQTFLDVERLAEGQMELKREPFAAAELVDTCLARAAPLAERKRIRISLDSPIEGTLYGDRELMEYALYNLLTNAVKYSPPETHVRVRAERRGAEWRLAVEDQGIGMDAKELKNIFRKFYRTQRAEASGEAGAGLGLSIVEQIVTHHGGRIDVTSTPGQGSCFTMILTAQ